MRRHVGNQLGAGRRAVLVAHHAQSVALSRETQHGAQKIRTARGIDPARAQQQQTRARFDRQFAGPFALAISVERGAGVVLTPRRQSLAVKDVVSRVVHQPGTKALGLARQHAGRDGVDRLRQFGFALGLIDRRVGSGIDDDIGSDGTHRRRDTVRIGKVAAETHRPLAVKGNDLAKRGQTALQFPANLAVLAEQQNLHTPRPS